MSGGFESFVHWSRWMISPCLRKKAICSFFVLAVVVHLRGVKASEIPYVRPCRDYHIVRCRGNIEGFGDETPEHLSTVPPVLICRRPVLVIPGAIIARTYALCNVPRDVVAAKVCPDVPELFLHLLHRMCAVDDLIIECLRWDFMHRWFQRRACGDDDEEAAPEALGRGLEERLLVVEGGVAQVVRAVQPQRILQRVVLPLMTAVVRSEVELVEL
eukprot:CAMPEP_0170199098 /NCGR_PEP_ID=MMETSP0040_2-20121228/69151_1 /TAXON_ID=641309 /ORGANISM="Lotharella oceanica, Strain CCMP622" /LENGTH=214 /DNA_ID=CAMNT_0010449185 /DNA_START=839 /DNA_END=1478 /DNA_ORIENTATION=+